MARFLTVIPPAVIDELTTMYMALTPEEKEAYDKQVLEELQDIEVKFAPFKFLWLDLQAKPDIALMTIAEKYGVDLNVVIAICIHYGF